MDTPNPTTTIQVTKINRDMLDALGKYMVKRHPELWGARGPTYNAIVGYAVDNAMTLLQIDYGARRP